MIVLVDVELAASDADARPEVGTEIRIDLLDTSLADADAVVVASETAEVVGVASSWLATAELVASDDIDPRSDLTVWVRVAASGEPHTADGDWITMQHVPVAATPDVQRVTAPVRRIGS